jgi:hypothetical protein
MPTAQWTNGSTGTLQPAVHAARECDLKELADAANRRLLLTYQAARSYGGILDALCPIRRAPLEGSAGPLVPALRSALAQDVLSAPVGVVGPSPATPLQMQWLWPFDDGDENKTIVLPQPLDGEVNLLAKLNGQACWTDPSLAAARVRAVHVNELRRAAEALVRGRWTLPLYMPTGLFSLLPDAPWIGMTVANSGAAELRAVAAVLLSTGDSSPRGLTGVRARSASFIELTADCDCTLELYRCLRDVAPWSDPPTWNEYAPASSLGWQSPGALGAQDAQLVGTLDLLAGTPGRLSSESLRAAIDCMIDGAPQRWLLRRADTGYETITITGGLVVVEFDLACPPN